MALGVSQLLRIYLGIVGCLPHAQKTGKCVYALIFSLSSLCPSIQVSPALQYIIFQSFSHLSTGAEALPGGGSYSPESEILSPVDTLKVLDLRGHSSLWHFEFGDLGHSAYSRCTVNI